MKIHDRLPIQTIEELQWEQFKPYLETVYSNSKYYAETFGELHIKPSDITSWKDLHKLPTFDTKTLLARNAEFPAVPPRGLRRIMVSGGTTGYPKLCFWDNIRAVTEAWASTWKAAKLTEEDVVTVMAPIPLASGFHITEIVEEIGCTSLPVGHTTPPEFTAKLMLQLHATSIISQPSTLGCFVEQIKKFNYHPKDFRLKSVLLGSEVLTDNVRRQIEQEWNCEVFDTSGSSEVGLIGAECGEHEGQHLSVGSAYFEVLDLETRLPVTEGVGQLFITTLLNLGLPLIRYDMKDIVHITSKPCKCGRTTPRISFMGRADDRFFLKTGVKFFSYQVDEALEPFESVTMAYNAIATCDHEKDSIKLIIEAQDAVLQDSELKKKISRAIITSSLDVNEIHNGRLLNDPEVEFVSIGVLERTPRGKIKNRFQDLRPNNALKSAF